MSNNAKYKRGSEWRIWDLHIHTPGTKKNDQFKGSTLDEKWERFFQTINNSTEKIAVVGITDYFCIENYFKFKEHITNSKITKKLQLILPNIEIRVLPVTDSSTPINLHCIFNPAIDQEIETRFLSKLKFDYSGSNYSAKKEELIRLGKSLPGNRLLDEGDALKAGINQYVISMETLRDVFDKDKILRDNTIVVVSNKSTDGVSGIRNHSDYFIDKESSQLDATRWSIYQFSDAIFSSNPNDSRYFNGLGVDSKVVVIEKCKKLMPCYHGSDAHTNEKVFNPNGHRFCWIKADPTFEGLKQTLYEPEERVKIQETDPALDFEKFAFSEIEITNPVSVFQNQPLQFDISKIPLNQNLVTIIGGRGTGKSVLINYLANGFKQYNVINDKSTFKQSSEFKVKWKKSLQGTEETFQLDKQHDLPFLFISQSEVKEKVRDSKDLGNEIKKILELENLYFDRKIDETIQDYKLEFIKIQEWFEKRDENNNPINSKSFVEGEIQRNKNLLERITTEENKEKLEKYSSNIEKLQSNNNDKINLEQLKTDLFEFQQSTNEQITLLNKEIPSIDFKPQFEAIVEAISNIETTVKSAQDENSKIREDFKDYKGDITSLLSNVERFRTTISGYERIKKEIEEKEKHLNVALINKKKIAELIKNELQKQAETVDKNWKKLLQGKEGWSQNQKELMKSIINNREIKIEGEIVFKKSAFYDLIKDQLDGRSFKGKNSYEELGNLLKIIDLNSYIDFLNNIDKSINKVEDYLRFSKEDFENIFYELQTRSTYLYIQPQITYKGKSLDKISVGQRGTIYLCLKLATNIFSQTIIFDQPEDDLDNDFIYNDIINIFKEIKRYRQVIIVTHNANIVVNADAEQVIVASNNEEKLSYFSGSLENPEINSEVCGILEGGKIAFQQRKNKYNFE